MIAKGRLSVALREASKTTVARPWRLALATLMGGLIMAAPAAFEMIALDTLTDTIVDEMARGSVVLVVESGSGTLDGRHCSAVAAQDGVVASGGVTAPAVVSVGEPALTTARSVRATPGYLEILWDTPPLSRGPHAVFGSDLATEVSIAEGAEIELGDTRLAAFSGPHSPRGESRGRWITVPVAHLDSVQQCWVEVRPAALAPIRAAIPAMFSDTAALEVTALRDQAITEAAVSGWRNRMTRWLSLVCGAVAGLVVGTLVAPRRAEFALYRLLGMPLPSVILIAAAESVLLLSYGMLFAGLTSSALVPLLDPIAPVELLSTLLVQLGLTSAVALSAVGISGILLTTPNPAQIIRTHR